ncbi:MAG: ribosome biogenesis GTPase YlqF [Peptostreptococcales bacterium]
MEHINWYPGHMKKTKEMIQENLKLVHVVIELLDARLPLSSKNPVIDEIIRDKKRIVLLNKSDLADSKVTKQWVEYYSKRGIKAIPVNAINGEGFNDLFKELELENKIINEKSARKRQLRVMIVGIPNVGKSSLINKILGKKSTKTGNKPGVTRGKQWVNMREGIQLLDTPGILWPKFEDLEVGLKLAYVGSIKDEVINLEEVALKFLELMKANYKQELVERYKLDDVETKTSLEMMEDISKSRGFLLSGNRYDYARAARTILDEYRNGIIGKISIERPTE